MPYRHDFVSPLRRTTLLLLLSGFTSCATPPLSLPEPNRLPPTPPTSPIAKSSEPEAEASTSEAPAAIDSTTIVVEVGAEANGLGADDIVSIARAEKDRRSRTPPPSIVITNDSLSRRPGPKTKPIAGKPAKKEPTAAAAPTSNRDADEETWRDRGFKIRMRIKESRDKVAKLRKMTAAMRQQFYLTPPQLGRDDTLWQEWGRLQESLAEAESKSQDTAKELDEYFEEGRMAGAEPGWLTEGEELLIDKKKDALPENPQAIEPPEFVPPGDGLE